MKSRNLPLAILLLIAFQLHTVNAQTPTSSIQEGTESIIIHFEPGSLYMETSGLKNLELFCDRLKRDHFNPDLNILLNTKYCYEEQELNEFIGVSRAQIVQNEILNCSQIYRNKILIQDRGSMDLVDTNPCVLNMLGVIPPRPVQSCKPGVVITVTPASIN